MTLSAVRISILQGWSSAHPAKASLREGLVGQMILLSPELPQAERDEVADLLALLVGLPVHVAARPSALPEGHLCLITDPIAGEPPPVKGSILLGVRAGSQGNRRLEASHELRILRDIVVECLGRHYAGTSRETIASWSVPVSDTPSLALRFASAAIARHLSEPDAPEAAIFAAGLASTVAWLLRGIDVRVAQWVVARALPAKHPERLVDTEAAILGEDAALQRAFASGLVELLPEEPGAPLDLRRPFRLLGDPEDRPVDLDLPTLARALHAALAPEVYVIVDRFLASTPKPLNLGGPDRPRHFVGRAEVLKRLRSLFEPADVVRTTVLYGVLGSGRTAVASAFCEIMGGTLEPVWISFARGPSSGWVPVANALEIPIEGDEGSPVPRWVKQVHDRLRDRACLVIVSDVDDVAEGELPGWLPAGPGECAVLVLSTSAQRVLQREQDAIAVPLRALSREESKELLAAKAPKLGEEIRAGEADGLLRVIDGHPGALVLAAGLLEKQGIAEVEALAKHREGPVRALVEKAVRALDAEEMKLAKALAVCAPEGSPPELPLGMAGVGEGVLGRLADRALVTSRKGRVRLHGVVRLAVEGGIEEEEREGLEYAHAARAAKLFRAARKTAEIETEDAAYDDALLALVRMTGRCRPGEKEVAEVAMGLASELWEYPRRNHAERLEHVVAGCEAALAVYDKSADAWQWADAQNVLGIALRRLPTGSRAENLRRAIDAYRAALTVWTREAHPADWAWAQNNLGNALSDLPTGDNAENLRQAIDAYRAALTVRTREADAASWAITQNNLGSALRQLHAGDREENLRQAIEAFRAALTVHTREAYPMDWAMAQGNLGTAFADFPRGDRAENLHQAIHAYRSALAVFTKNAFPVDWAMAHYNIGLALRALPSGDRKQNLRDAIDAFRAALTVYTPEAFPADHARTQAALDAALRDLAALEAPFPPSEP